MEGTTYGVEVKDECTIPRAQVVVFGTAHLHDQAATFVIANLSLTEDGRDVLGGDGADAADELTATRKMLLSKGFLIAGGSSEVQLNVIAKRVLGLPD